MHSWFGPPNTRPRSTDTERLASIGVPSIYFDLFRKSAFLGKFLVFGKRFPFEPTPFWKNAFWENIPFFETMFWKMLFWENIPFCNDALLADHAWALAALAFFVGALPVPGPGRPVLDGPLA